MRGTEPHREVDGRLVGGDALVDRSLGLVGDGAEDPVADRLGGQTLVRDGRSGDIGHLHAPTILVSVEAATGLPAEVTRGHEPLLDRRRSQPVGPVEPLPDPPRRREGDVDAGQVHQLERAHREAAGAQGGVDLVDPGAA